MATLSPFEQKYQANIAGLAKANNVDTGAAKDMLISNLTAGGQYKGGGVLDFNAAAPDAHAYIAQAKQQAQTTPMQPAAAPQSNYLDQLTSGIDNMQNAQKVSQLQALRQQQQKATGLLNQQRAEAAPQYQNMRNQTDVGNAAAVQKLREAMANQGLFTSGDNNTEMTNLRINRENQLNNTNLQEQQMNNDFNRRIADVNDPAQEQAINNAVEAQRMQLLYDAMQKANDVNFRNSQFDYQKQRDTSNDTFRNDQFAYQKTRDALGDEFRQKQFDEDNRRFGLTYALQQAGVTGFMQDGTPTFAREQFNSDNAFKQQQLAQQAALASMRAASTGAKSSATAQKKASAEATKQAITELGKYDNYEQAANDFSNYFQDMKAAGIDTDAVEKAIQVRFRNTERSWIQDPGAASDLAGQQLYGKDWWKN